MVAAKHSLFLRAVTCLLLAELSGCQGRIFTSTPPTPIPIVTVTPDAGGVPFQPLPPDVYGAKVKNLLVAQALTDAELQQLTANPSALPTLVDGWMAQPQWRDRMMLFFKQAFQQTQTPLVDYVPVFNGGLALPAQSLNNFEEMFPRTALELIDEGVPFTQVVTTTRFMVTPALLSLLTYRAATFQDDNLVGLPSQWWPIKAYPYPKGAYQLQSTAPIPMQESIDPTSPNFMTWYDPTYNPDGGGVVGDPKGCTEPFNPSLSFGGVGLYTLEMFLLTGTRRTNHNCGTVSAPVAVPTDWTTWRMVNFRTALPADSRTPFWDFPTLRSTSEVVTDIPYVGFMTTPAFLANWPTNTSNQARVTLNQTLIVALGYAIAQTPLLDGGIGVPISPDDLAHASDPACAECHQTMDPMRNFLRQSFTYAYGPRPLDYRDDAGIPDLAMFSVPGGTQTTGNSVTDLANALANHPRFAIAWAQKLCRFANSSSCQESDPEFQRIVQDFKASNYNFKTLMKEMFTSPLVTFAAQTQTGDLNGEVISIARQAQFCDSLSNRSGVNDVCGLHGTNGVSQIALMSLAIPGDSYARGQEEPQMPIQPDLFFQSATENICVQMAKLLVDTSQSTLFRSNQADAGISDLVTLVMGIPSTDARFDPLRGVLRSHFDQAQTKGASPTYALQSTFITACEAPLLVSSGL